jgi:hypothetical protein
MCWTAIIALKARSTHAGGLCLAVLLASVAGCASIQPPHAEPLPAVTETPHAVPEFIITAGMLDTWNAIGQIVVHLDGVYYLSRSQMLGIYEVSYRGERFLIVTRALVMGSETQVMSTRVSAVLPDGKPNGSSAAIELLDILHTRLPEELRNIAAKKGRGGKQ